MSDALATLVIVPRERFSAARRSLESIYEHTEPPFELVYVDGGSPAKVRRFLEQESRRRNFRLVRTDHYLTPNEARNLGLSHVTTRYVVFVDNDVLVMPGWLDKLVACAEETSAWAVGPLYCWGDPAKEIVHMAGGEATVEERDGVRYLKEKLRFANRPLAEVRPQLERREDELVEFHCMLVRRDVFDRLGPLDEGLMSTREHVDFCIAVRDAGGTVYFEPEAVTTYLGVVYGGMDSSDACPRFEWSDIPYYLLRWSDAWCEASLRRVNEKWQVTEDHALLIDKWICPHRRIALWRLRQVVRAVLGEDRGNRAGDALDRLLIRGAVADRRRAGVAAELPESRPG